MSVKNMVTEIVQDKVESAENVLPNPSSAEWTKYFMSQLETNELEDGYPSAHAIRRVTKKIYADILSSESEYLGVTPFGSVVVKHILVVRRYSDDQTLEVSACVDVHPNKLASPFNDHPVATACTSAEGKALRRLLGIQIYSKEEAGSNVKDQEIDMADTVKKISDQQILVMNTLAERNNINVAALVKTIVNKKLKNVYDITNSEARLIVDQLSEYGRVKAPVEHTGYKKEWENNL